MAIFVLNRLAWEVFVRISIHILNLSEEDFKVIFAAWGVLILNSSQLSEP